MIVSRTPFRVSFVGGGSDLRSFYVRSPGRVLSTTINRYMYLLVHPFFDRKIQVKYSKTELVDRIDDIQHPIVRAALQQTPLHGIDINSVSDIPAGTGLGTSSSFTVGLLHAIEAYCGRRESRESLARRACHIEMDILQDPIGKQDAYAAAFGGFNLITFLPDESVEVEPLDLSDRVRERLQRHLLVFYVGNPRSAKTILGDQQNNVSGDQRKYKCLVRMTVLANLLAESLISEKIEEMGPILDENWHLKKELSRYISDSQIDKWYDLARKNGATGGKLLGAGGGGFLLLFCNPERQEPVRRALASLREIDFGFETMGTQVIFSEVPGGLRFGAIADNGWPVTQPEVVWNNRS